MKLFKKKSSLLAVLLWTMSFILAFRIPPHSQYIWIPDALLLLGFFPLLIAGRARWLWLAFGLGNLVVGATLALAICIPDRLFEPYHMAQMNAHLRLYHPYLVWLLISLLSAVIGVILLIISLASWLIKIADKKQN